MIGFEVNRGRRGIRRGEVLNFDPATWKAYVTLDGSLSAVELAVGNWVPAAGLGPGARVAVMLFDENNPADGLIVGAYGLASPSVDGLTWFKPTDTFNRFVNWTWATDGIFDGPPSTVDLTLWPGLVRLANDSITEDHFAYRTVSGNTAIAARLSKGVNSYVGLRLDEGAGGITSSLAWSMARFTARCGWNTRARAGRRPIFMTECCRASTCCGWCGWRR